MARSEETSNPGVKLNEMLRAKRTERGITIEKAREDTKIPHKYIVALEEGNFKTFPARVYLRGFFLAYCKYLGIPNAESYLPSLYGTPEIPEPPAPQTIVDVAVIKKTPPPSSANAAARKSEPPQAASHNGGRRHQQDKEGAWAQFSLWMLDGQNRILAFVVLPAVLLAVFFGVYSYVRHKQYESQPADVFDVPGLLGHQKNQQAKGPNIPELVPVGKKTASTARINLELATKGEPGWIQVESDGEIMFQGILPAKQKRSFAAGNVVKLRLGNPKSLEIKVNDNIWPLSKEDMEKTPLEMTLSADNLPARR